MPSDSAHATSHSPLTRPAVALFALALAVGAGTVRLNSTNPAAQVAAGLVDPAQVPQLVDLAREALRRDSANAYRWADLAEALDFKGDTIGARKAFDRAATLSDQIPQIWLRQTNFFVGHNQPEDALRTAARVLAIVPDYDTVLFNYLDGVEPEKIAAAIAGNPRAMRSWFQYQIARNHSEAAKLAWSKIPDRGIKLTSFYVDYLVRTGDLDRAVRIWSDFLGDRRGDYPRRNLVYNGAFTSEFLESPLDWNIRSSADFETARDGNSVRITFSGAKNVNYANLTQTVILPSAGTYRFTARIMTRDITTNEGVRLAIPDLAVSTEPLGGTTDWTPVSIDFTVSAPRAIGVALIRQPSRKFDNKISGTAFVSAVAVLPVR